MLKQIFNRQNLPWILTGVFALALVVVLFAKIGGDGSPGNEINGVVQDSSGKRVTAWVDPMYSQGPPHTTRSNKPGRAVDCGMKLIPLYADDTSSGSGPAPSTVKGYSNVSLSPQRQQLIGVKLGMAEIRDLSRVARTVGTVAVDETRRAQIHAKFEGYVEQLYVNFTGEVVRRGQPLLSIYSPDLLATENDLLLASRARKPIGQHSLRCREEAPSSLGRRPGRNRRGGAQRKTAARGHAPVTRRWRSPHEDSRAGHACDVRRRAL